MIVNKFRLGHTALNMAEALTQDELKKMVYLFIIFITYIIT